MAYRSRVEMRCDEEFMVVVCILETPVEIEKWTIRAKKYPCR